MCAAEMHVDARTCMSTCTEMMRSSGICTFVRVEIKNLCVCVSDFAESVASMHSEALGGHTLLLPKSAPAS